MQDTWFISDTHFSHKNILSYEQRPFKDTDEMDEVLIHNWNSVVKPHDLIFHLGDVFFCGSERQQEICTQLNGRKILIRGNHDKQYSDTKFRKLGFEPFKYYVYGDFLLSHRPQHLSAMKSLIANTHIKGNVHGHVHSKIEHLDQTIYKCVSVELTDYNPVHIDDIYKHFKQNV